MAGESELSDAATVIVVADAGADASDTENAVSASGLCARRGALAGAAAMIADHPHLAGVIVDGRRIAELAPGALAEVADAATANRVRLIALFNTAQLDAVGATLLGGNALLFCEPEPLDLASGLALLASERGLTLRDASRETARLQRLNEEVARFAATLARLTDRAEADDAGGGSIGQPFVADRAIGFATMPADLDPAEVRRAIRARRLRDEFFAAPALFEDPAWDMLLDLFAAELERRQVSVSSLCIAAAVAPTTALRWIGKLMTAGLLDRQPDAFDRRRAFIALSARASAAMRDYVTALRRAGLAIA